MTVSHILKTKGDEVISLQVGCTVSDVAKILGERRIGAIPIMDGDKIAGIISERDVVRGLAIRGGDVLKDDVSTLMTKSVTTCATTTTVRQLMEMMTERRIRHVPIVEGGKLVGMVTIGDVVNERLHETEQEAEALKEYIASA
ncbi:inosine-5-monophosphate dehydrogenase [Kordiimonas sediminis]|uniref:Inosine-5-monophosphate dehydrogenase n=1 Tax=Kordiimonas sediminis TaxID=1735581 RepID=A0A919EAM6_9PROT|nr:CBS domain-containing protein [Kordiimonas sediminis]GHF30541.1 inosine-5-monophosphate dehydrogenase [Kordiimonas sediminis]